MSKFCRLRRNERFVADSDVELVDGLEPPTDLLITNQLLYQLSYTSMFGCSRVSRAGINISYLVQTVKGVFAKRSGQIFCPDQRP